MLIGCVIFLAPGGYFIFLALTGCMTFFGAERLCDFFLVPRGCLTFFFTERLHEFSFTNRLRVFFVCPKRLHDVLVPRGGVIFCVRSFL